MHTQQNSRKFWQQMVFLTGLLSLGWFIYPSPKILAAKRIQRPYLDKATAAGRAQNLSEIRYHLSLHLDADSKTYSGKVDIEFKLKDNKTPLQLDFVNGDIQELNINGTSTSTRSYRGNFIELNTQLLRSGRNTVSVSYAHEYSSSGPGLYRVNDPEDGNTYVVSDLEPYFANQLFPSFDQPDLKSKITLTVEAPAAWHVISTVRERDVSALKGSKHRRWQFPESPLLSTYAFVVAAGPFAIWEDRHGRLPLRLLTRKSHAPFVDYREWFAITKKGLQFFEDYFAYRFPFPKYDQLIVPDLISGAMENVGAATFAEDLAPRTSATETQRLERTEVILHELAHMWFGNLVTMRWWDDLWLNESFATYMSFVAMDKALGIKTTWRHFNAATKAWAYDADLMPKPHPVRAEVDNTDVALSSFDGITYGKGAAILRQLAYFMNEEKFRDSVRLYFKTFAFQNATTADFFGALKKNTKLDLGIFAERWFDTAGLETLTPVIDCAGGKITRFLLHNEPASANAQPRPQRFAIVTYRTDAKGLLIPDQRVLVEADKAETNIAVLKGRTCPQLTLVDAGDHGYARIRLDKKSLSAVRKQLHRVASPDVRLLLWQRLWLMLMHNEIPLAEFAAIAADNLPKENQAMIFRVASDMIIGGSNGRTPSLLRFSSMHRQAIAEQWEQLLWIKLKAAENNHDLQEVVFDRYLASVRSGNGREQLLRMLSGDWKQRGFVLDQEKRWHILLQLAVLRDERVADLVKKEAKSDPSLEGKRYQRSIASAIASEREKRSLLKSMAADTNLSLADRHATLAYLAPLAQIERLKWLEDDFFDVLPQVFRNLDAASAATFIALTAPLHCSEQILRRYRGFSAKNQPALVQNELALQVRDLQRCLKF